MFRLRECNEGYVNEERNDKEKIVNRIICFLAVLFASFQATSQQSTPVSEQPNLGQYRGTLVGWGPTYRMETDFVASKDQIGGAYSVTGTVTILAGFCDGTVRPFSGTLKGTKLQGMTNGPSPRCDPHLVLDADVTGAEIKGTIAQGSNVNEMKLTRKK